GWWPRLSLRYMRCARLAFEPRLRCREARQARNRRREIDRFPFRVEAGFLQLANPREQVGDKTFDALKAVRLGRKIESDERGRNGNRRYSFARLDQIGIVRGIERGGQIVVFELAVIGHWQELEPRLPTAAHESIYRLRRNEDDPRHLALTHLLKRDLMRDECLFHLEAYPTEDQRARIGRCGALGIEVHFFTCQIVQTLNLGTNEDMKFGRK